MNQTFSASIWQEGEWFIAQCVQVDVASQGATEDEALDNLRDAIELHFSPAVATLVAHVRDIEGAIRAL
jgi:predicted RNase H-like HicB family nuclease